MTEVFGGGLPQSKHVGLLRIPRDTHANAKHGQTRIDQLETRHQTGLRAGAACRVDEVVDMQTAFVDLVH